MAELSVEAVDRAVKIIRDHWHAGMAVILARVHDPNAVPEYGETATIDGICRRIVAGLLNEGWTPPDLAWRLEQAGYPLNEKETPDAC